MELILWIIAFLLLVLNVWIFSIVDAINELKEKETETDKEIDDFFQKYYKPIVFNRMLKTIDDLQRLEWFGFKDKLIQEMVDDYKKTKL